MNPLPPPLPRGGRRSYEMGEDPSRLLSALAAQHGAHLPSMMAPFRHARRVNPSAHDAKLRFWAAALRDLVVDKGVGLDSRYTVDAKSLPGALVVDGVAPQALPHALAALKRDGDLADPSAFLVADARDTPRHNSTWTGTLVSALLVAPLTWGLATLGVVDPSDSGSNIDEEVHAGALVVPARVDADVSLLATVARNTASRLDALLTPSELLDRAGLHSAGLSRADIELLLAHAARRGVLAIDQSSTGTTTMVKLARASDEGTAVSIADVDRHAFRVKTAAELVARQAADVEAKADVALAEARTHLAGKRKPAALRSLARKRALESVASKRHAALDTLTAVAHAIDAADSDAAVVGAVTAGATALRALVPSVEQTDATMDALADALADARDVDDALAAGYRSAESASGTVVDEDELERELEALVAEQVLAAPGVPSVVPVAVSVVPMSDRPQEERETVPPLLAAASNQHAARRALEVEAEGDDTNGEGVEPVRKRRRVSANALVPAE